MPLVEDALLEILACPQCHAPLSSEEEVGDEVGEPTGELVCTGSGCGLAYPVNDGIPVLLVDEARRPS